MRCDCCNCVLFEDEEDDGLCESCDDRLGSDQPIGVVVVLGEEWG